MLLFLFSLVAGFSGSDKNATLLCLGDSYTIGQSVSADERFPEQTVALLNNEGIAVDAPVIIARTGWTTQNLIDAVEQKNIDHTFDYVTLLIGVNDQFQGKDIGVYEKNFEQLLRTAIQYAGKKADHVFVLSIPDYGITPFAQYGRQAPQQISAEIDKFNAVNKKIAEKYKVNYIDITPISRKATADNTLLAGDGLHPSGKMYGLWAELLADYIEKIRH